MTDDEKRDIARRSFELLETSMSPEMRARPTVEVGECDAGGEWNFRYEKQHPKDTAFFVWMNKYSKDDPPSLMDAFQAGIDFMFHYQRKRKGSRP